MGLTAIKFCPRHGNQVFMEFCAHNGKIIDDGKVPGMKRIPFIGTVICNQCFEIHQVEELAKVDQNTLRQFSETNKVEFESKIRAVYQAINCVPKCLECVNQLLLTNARTAGKKLPFEAYENTLTFKDEETIKRLETYLNQRFTFKKSKIAHLDRAAFFTQYGGISYPFSIKFYYVIEKERQEKLLDLIEKFYASIPKKERLIQFYEAENIMKKSDGSLSRGKENLLLKKMIK